jgi:hypothetical protein
MRVFSKNIRFNRHEFAGSFGDIGTDLPLILALIAASNLDFSSVFIMFGIMQILSGLIYGLPMPMQPLKAMAIIMISQKLPGHLLYAAGITIGVVMLLLTISDTLTWLQKKIPPQVIRGLQIGLGLSLLKISALNYLSYEGTLGYLLFLSALILYLTFKNNKKIPASFLIIILGLIYILFFQTDTIVNNIGFSFNLPSIYVPNLEDLSLGFVLLALPQLPLSLSNSVLATHKTINDFFPDKKIGINKIGLSYSLANLFSPLLSGIPICHGSGGLAGHYAFGARTGGSVIIYGLCYLITGFFFSSSTLNILSAYPKSIIGFILMVEALVLINLSRDLIKEKRMLGIALIVGIIALLLPHGYLIGASVGLLLSHLSRSKSN